MTSILEKKRKELTDLKNSVEDMRAEILKKREQREKERAKRDICFWMDNAVLPFLEEIAACFNEPLLDGIRRLIKEQKNPFQPKKDWNRTRETKSFLTGFINLPQNKLLLALAKPFIRYNMQWIHKEAEWIREEILKQEYPDFYMAIMETEGGQQWLDQLINGLIKTIRRFL